MERFCRVQQADFDPAALEAALLAGAGPGNAAGAVATFTGLVRCAPGDAVFLPVSPWSTTRA
jgi:molybdopterin synthase catalytic subunit